MNENMYPVYEKLLEYRIMATKESTGYVKVPIEFLNAVDQKIRMDATTKEPEICEHEFESQPGQKCYKCGLFLLLTA